VFKPEGDHGGVDPGLQTGNQQLFQPVRIARVDEWQVDPHRKRGDALRSGSERQQVVLLHSTQLSGKATESDPTLVSLMAAAASIAWSGGVPGSAPTETVITVEQRCRRRRPFTELVE
jgi:hypothetical protein